MLFVKNLSVNEFFTAKKERPVGIINKACYIDVLKNKNLGYFDDIIHKIFGSGSDQPKEPVNVKKPLKRTSSFMDGFENWMKSPAPNFFARQILSDQKETTEGKVGSAYNLQFYRTPYANGFFFTFMGGRPKVEFDYYLEYLKMKTEGLGYKLYTAERDIKDKSTFVETVERYYFKPPLGSEKDGYFDQLYGNIMIENVFADQQPSYTKLLSTIYSDRKFAQPGSFDEFFELLFK